MSQIVLAEDLYVIMKKYEERLSRLERAIAPIIIHRVGISTALDALSPPFLNSWDNYTPGYTVGGNPQTIVAGWSPAVFYKDRGRTFISGLIFSTNGAGNLQIFQLPDGYRPNNNHMFTCEGQGGVARVDIDGGTGIITNRSGSGNGTGATPNGSLYLSLEGSFPHA